MKKEYDFSKLKSRKNPYTKYLKKQITIRINNQAIDYFKKMSDDVGIPYQNLIDSYLSDCASNHRKLITKWS
jgi:predicted DNA binding CopG/RHH family protein